jgi:hypothetical protein
MSKPWVVVFWTVLFLVNVAVLLAYPSGWAVFGAIGCGWSAVNAVSHL